MTATFDPSRPWQVRGLGAGEPVVLHEAPTYSDATQWFRSYTRSGDWGGWEVLDIYDALEAEVQDEYVRSDIED
jgi:hypothetical protein